MAVTRSWLVSPSRVTTSAAGYYTAPSSTAAVVNQATACNTTGTVRWLSVNLVPSGDSVGDGNLLIDQVAVPANDQIILSELLGHTIPTGASINMTAEAASAITVTISGTEIS